MNTSSPSLPNLTGLRAEIERRIASRSASLIRADYEPGPNIRAIWGAEDPEICAVGPGGVGKTRGILEMLHRDALAYPKSRQLIARETRTSLTQSTMVTLETKVFPEGTFGDWDSGRPIRFHNGDQQYVYPNGSVIVVAGAEEETRLFSTDWDRIYFSEVNETTLEKFESLWRGLRNKMMARHQLIADMNPTYEMHWMHQRCDSGVCREILVGHDDNPTITADDKARLARQYSGDRYTRLFAGKRVASTEDSYYGALLHDARAAGRIGRVGHEPKLRVFTTWDLGIDDATAIWCLQVVGREVRAIDYYEGRNVGLPHYAGWLLGRGYVFEKHFLPHDIEVRELGSGTSRHETLKSLLKGHGTIVVCKRVDDLADKHEAVRNLIPRMWFDNTRRGQDQEQRGFYEGCFRGVQGLLAYQKQKNQKTGEYLPQPLHNWASHVADSLGEFAVNINLAKYAPDQREERVRYRPAFLG